MQFETGGKAKAIKLCFLLLASRIPKHRKVVCEFQVVRLEAKKHGFQVSKAEGLIKKKKEKIISLLYGERHRHVFFKHLPSLISVF